MGKRDHLALSQHKTAIHPATGMHTQMKSCPSCSVAAGAPVFYPVEDFGLRAMGDGEFTVQSYCPKCRSGYESQGA